MQRKRRRTTITMQLIQIIIRQNLEDERSLKDIARSLYR